MTPITSEQTGKGAAGTRPEEAGLQIGFGKSKAFHRKMVCFLKVALLCAAFLASSARAQLYAVDSSRAFYQIDMTTGAATLLGTVSANASTTAGLAYNPGNHTIYLTSSGNDSLYTLDLTTFTATLVGAYGDAAIVMHGLEFDDATGLLYGVSSHNNGLYTISTTTGLATLIGTSGLTSFTNIGYNSLTNQMFATNSGTDSFYSMNITNGSTTLIGPLVGPTNPNGLAFNRDNGLMYMVDNNTDNLYTIDMATGAATVIGSTGSHNFLGLVYIPIPEPTSVLLVGLGGALLVARRWGRQRTRRD